VYVLWCPCLQPAHRHLGHELGEEHGSYVLCNARAFNQPIGTWDTSSVELFWARTFSEHVGLGDHLCQQQQHQQPLDPALEGDDSELAGPQPCSICHHHSVKVRCSCHAAIRRVEAVLLIYSVAGAEYATCVDRGSNLCSVFSCDATTCGTGVRVGPADAPHPRGTRCGMERPVAVQVTGSTCGRTTRHRTSRAYLCP
jgi:hypothetical protein